MFLQFMNEIDQNHYFLFYFEKSFYKNLITFFINIENLNQLEVFGVIYSSAARVRLWNPINPGITLFFIHKWYCGVLINPQIF